MLLLFFFELRAYREDFAERTIERSRKVHKNTITIYCIYRLVYAIFLFLVPSVSSEHSGINCPKYMVIASIKTSLFTPSLLSRSSYSLGEYASSYENNIFGVITKYYN